ncbi:SDR family NAD(P)-dependent oxidoreductase [Microbaculum marinum]|uniref:SDR family NAD(P)-dependent oxidoreductase n=1 Tax=Microbaculum marinum TaxID=1764581 RepID=A0AAW9RNM5_9HYPH
MSIRFDGRVAIVTGAGSGLGRSHALALAERGAKVVVNDLGSAMDGTGMSEAPALAVVDEIRAQGGAAIVNEADVTNADQVTEMVEETIGEWGRVDILVNNAGILRDRTFANMGLDDFRKVVDVHLLGSVICTKAVWPLMREQGYGRVVMTSSSSGLYGNFGQANYAAAKSAMLGLCNALHLEGEKYDIRVNVLSPAAATRMVEGLVEDDVLDQLDPSAVSPGLLYLVSEDAPSRIVLCAGAGSFARYVAFETRGIYLPPDERTPEAIAARFGEISDPTDGQVLNSAFEQTLKFVHHAAGEAQI